MKQKTILIISVFLLHSILEAQPYSSQLTSATPNYVTINQNQLPPLDFVNRPLTLDFEDNFDGNQLDPLKWVNGYGWGPTLGGNSGSNFWADPSEIHISGGTLKLGLNHNQNSSVINPGDPTVYTRDYSAGIISTLQTFNYGIYKIRCKIPLMNQHFPAFWAYGANDQEIDVFEFTAGDNKKADYPCSPSLPKWYAPMNCASAEPIFTWHSPTNATYGSTNTQSGTRYSYCDWDVVNTTFNPNVGCQYTTPSVWPSFHDDWHEFSVNYTPLSITWSIDGSPVRVVCRYSYYYFDAASSQYKHFPITSTLYYDEYNLPSNVKNSPYLVVKEQMNFPVGGINMKMIINNGILQQPDYNLYNYVDNNWDWPDGFLEVDYCQHYSYNSCNDVIKICNYSDLDPINYPNNTLKGLSVKLGTDVSNNTNCNFVKPVNYPLSVIATNEIALVNNFSAANVMPGGEMVLRIGTCSGGNVYRTSNDDPTLNKLALNEFRNHSTVERKTKSENVNSDMVLISPNPSNGLFKVSFNNKFELPNEVYISDMLGNKIAEALTINSYEMDFDLKDYKNGVYTIWIKYSNNSAVKKIIKM